MAFLYIFIFLRTCFLSKLDQRGEDGKEKKHVTPLHQADTVGIILANTSSPPPLPPPFFPFVFFHFCFRSATLGKSTGPSVWVCRASFTVAPLVSLCLWVERWKTRDLLLSTDGESAGWCTMYALTM